MKRRTTLCLVALITLLVSLINISPALANPPYPEDGQPTGAPLTTDTTIEKVSPGKTIDQPNALDVMRNRAMQILREQGNMKALAELQNSSDRILVILVEYAGTDTFTWTPGVSTWDPIGKADIAEDAENLDCSKIPGIPTVPTNFVYGPTLHNQIPQPESATDASGNSIWTPDFSKEWFNSFMFGEGVVFDYDRKDESHVHEDFTGKSVKNYYLDMSKGTYDIEGDIIGWIELPHSTWWYGADTCPGRRSQSAMTSSHGGGIPEAGSAKTLVQDALDKVEELRLASSPLIPTDFDWANYDQNGDGIIDRLWIVHAGYGEEDNTTLMNRTDYSEAAMWSHSSSVTPLYEIGESGIKAGPYIMMPENGGIGVFAHEYGHNLGADDLYAYGNGETSTGFWSLMADDWTGYPLGFMPPSVDPWHLDNWGWLDPVVINDPAQVYTVTVGQPSEFPGGEGVTRGVKIELPDGHMPLPIGPATGDYNWWGGNLSLSNAMMTLKEPVAIPAGGATLSFNMVYDIEAEWDFLWVQASTDGGTTWKMLTNVNTTCTHVDGWVGELYGLPDDLCAANMGGFTSFNANSPDYDEETFTLDAATFGGKDVLFQFWYMTDWGTQYAGPFIDDIAVKTLGTQPAILFSDGAEVSGDNWTYTNPFQRTDGTVPFTHNYYLQWRNTTATGGYDSGLGDNRYRFGPVNSGLLVWYNNNYYTDNEVANYLTDYPSFGPKGRMLVLDSHPDPLRDPYYVSTGYDNEGGNLSHRSLMRDATFSLNNTNAFAANPPYTVNTNTTFASQPGVSSFDDSLGYYPGAEYVSRGTGYNPPSFKWFTKQWDASTVVPSTREYALKAPGYMNEEFRFNCSRYTGNKLSCYWFGPGVGLGYNGGTGNPGDIGGQFGWHVDILSQTDKTATLRIYNTNAHHSFAADKSTVLQGGLVKFTYTLTEAPVDEALFTCTDLDTSKVSYVSSSNAIPLSVPCEMATDLGVMGGDLDIATDASTVKAVAYMKGVIAGDNDTFDFTVKALNSGDSFTQVLNVYDNKIHRVYDTDQSTFITSWLWMPIMVK